MPPRRITPTAVSINSLARNINQSKKAPVDDSSSSSDEYDDESISHDSAHSSDDDSFFEKDDVVIPQGIKATGDAASTFKETMRKLDEAAKTNMDEFERITAEIEKTKGFKSKPIREAEKEMLSKFAQIQTKDNAAASEKRKATLLQKKAEAAAQAAKAAAIAQAEIERIKVLEEKASNYDQQQSSETCGSDKIKVKAYCRKKPLPKSKSKSS